LFEDGAQRIVLGDHNANGIADTIGIASNLVIQGPGAHLLAISGNDQAMVLSAGYGKTITIADLAIEHGSYQYGGGGINSAADLTLDGVTVRNNHSNWRGGGLHSVGGDLTILESTFLGNTSEYGAGLYVNPNTTSYPESDGVYSTRIENSSFYENEAVAYANLHGGVGGGAYLNGTSALEVEILNSTFSGNGATKGGGLSLHNAANFDIVNTTITDNDTYVNGVSGSNLVAGGGLFLHTVSDLTLHNTIVAGNTSVHTYRTNISNTNSSIQPESSHNLIEKGAAGYVQVAIADGVSGNIVVNHGTYLGLARRRIWCFPTVPPWMQEAMKSRKITTCCSTNGDSRVSSTWSGLTMPEEI
jgi:hypothetical protein